jgi:hypothetical protein
VVEAAIKAHGGKLEAFYFAFGKNDAYLIAAVPDHVSVAAVTVVVNASGTASVRTTVLLTPEEIVYRLACLLRFFQTSARNDTLALHEPFTSIRLGRGLSPASCRTCTAYQKKGCRIEATALSILFQSTLLQPTFTSLELLLAALGLLGWFLGFFCHGFLRCRICP